LLTALSLAGDDPGFIETPYFWVLLLASPALLIALYRHEQRTTEPMLDLHLILKNPFLAINLYNFFFGACTFGFLTFIPYFAVLQFQMGPAESGAILTP